MLVLGVVFVLVGAFMALFGTVYFITPYAPVLSLHPITAYYLCPIWKSNIPTFVADDCIRLTGPIFSSQFVNLSSFAEVNYLSNFIGIGLILLGVAVVVMGHGRN